MYKVPDVAVFDSAESVLRSLPEDLVSRTLQTVSGRATDQGGQLFAGKGIYRGDGEALQRPGEAMYSLD